MINRRAHQAICFLGLLMTITLCLNISADALGQEKPASPKPPSSGSTQKSMSASKSAQAQPIGGLYGNIELRHHINTYYEGDSDGEGEENAEGDYVSRKEPSVHTRLQLGLRLYGNLVDAFLTLGVYKTPETQQISQRRPELEIDVYPINNEYVTVQGYSIIQAPFNSETQGPSDSETEDRVLSSKKSEGTAISVGITPLAKYPISLGSSKVVLKTGIDAWTKLYSRRQYTTVRPDDEERDRLGLAPDDTGEQEIEDFAQHYGTEGMLGAGFWNANVSELSADLGAFYTTRHTPKYSVGEDSTDYSYDADRTSHYRFRLQYQWSPRVAIVNDFFQFHDGRFGALENGENRRYRNIARITCRL